MDNKKVWEKAQKWEAWWHGTCVNEYGEEEKQLVYASRMGLQRFHDGRSPYNFDMEGKTILDMGGGATSLLLKCLNVKGTVVDPLPLPEWVKLRYKEAGIEFINEPAESGIMNTNGGDKIDEVWIYNCLQHTEDPKLIIENAKKSGKLIRIFEWIDTATNEGHPHSLKESELNEWLGGEGKVEVLNLPTLRGKCYYGIFPTENYGKNN